MNYKSSLGVRLFFGSLFIFTAAFSRQNVRAFVFEDFSQSQKSWTLKLNIIASINHDRIDLANEVMEATSQAISAKKSLPEKITIYENKKAPITLETKPDPWNLFWHGFSKQFFLRYHRELPKTVLNNLISFSAGMGLTALSTGPVGILLGVGFVVYLGYQAADILSEISHGRYENAGRKLFDVANNLFFAGLGSAWATKLMAKQSTKFLGKILWSLRDAFNPKTPPIITTAPRYTPVKSPVQGVSVKIKTPTYQPAAESVGTTSTMTLETTLPVSETATLTAFEPVTTQAPGPTPFMTMPLVVDDFKKWRQNFVAATDDEEILLNNVQRILKQPGYLSHHDKEVLKYFNERYRHTLLPKSVQLKAHTMASTSEEAIHSYPDALETFGYKVIEEALAGHIELKHINALKTLQQLCQIDKNFAQTSSKLCARVARLINPMRSGSPRPPIHASFEQILNFYGFQVPHTLKPGQYLIFESPDGLYKFLIKRLTSGKPHKYYEFDQLLGAGKTARTEVVQSTFIVMEYREPLHVVQTNGEVYEGGLYLNIGPLMSPEIVLMDYLLAYHDRYYQGHNLILTSESTPWIVLDENRAKLQPQQLKESIMPKDADIWAIDNGEALSFLSYYGFVDFHYYVTTRTDRPGEPQKFVLDREYLKKAVKAAPALINRLRDVSSQTWEDFFGINKPAVDQKNHEVFLRRKDFLLQLSQEP